MIHLYYHEGDGKVKEEWGELTYKTYSGKEVKKMSYKYSLGSFVFIKTIIGANFKIIDRLSKPELNLYQVKVFEGKYKGKKLRFAEHEIEEINS